jgi:hypothetical protein
VNAVTKTFDPVLERILVEHGPLNIDDIRQRLHEAGIADPDIPKPIDMEMACPTRQLVDDRWVWLPSVLGGRVFTHRLSNDEAVHNFLTLTPDLSSIAALCEYEQYQRLADGSTAQLVDAEYDDELLEQRAIPVEVADSSLVLLLEAGTLTALHVTEGDLVGVRLTADGLALERVTTVAPPAAGPALAATLHAGEPEFIDSAVWTACVADQELFTEPSPPLGEIVDAQGLARRNEWFAPAEFDFNHWDMERECERLAERHDIDPDEAFTLHMLVKLYANVALLVLVTADEDDPPEDALTAVRESAAGREFDRAADLIGELGAALADPTLAELLVDETRDTGRAGANTLWVFAELMEPKVPSAARVAYRWLRAVALQRMGDIDTAERELLAAESMDVNWPPPLFDLARIASDRGDAERGLALLRRAGAEPDHPLLELLQRYRTEPRRGMGRNELCWCDSGRKYKKCHLGREELPLAERVGWLYAKAALHALTDWTELLIEVDYERHRNNDDDEFDFEALGDPLVIDAVLFEGGAFEEFLEVRGSLLPDDERLLAEQWLLLERSVFEVEQVHHGQGLTVRDVRTGDRHEVRERAASRQVKPGQLFCARVVPAGDTMQFFGGIEPVALHERDALIELLDDGPDAVTLVAQLSRRLAPPTLTNTEGDPLVLCSATVHFGDQVALLDDTFDRVDGDGPARWFEHVMTHGMHRIRATLMLDGDTLQVETNSEERMNDVLATLARLDPAMRVLDDSRQPMRDAREAAELAKQTPATSEDATTPEIASAVADFIRDYESKWLDESIPALDNYTPRQAADDPTRRGDLIKLLDSFPAGAAARGGMDVDRLRAALGLR